MAPVSHAASMLGQALLMAAGMAWRVGWSLVLGFAISAILQVVVSSRGMAAALGRNGVRQIALATLAGAASSSCSYASAAVSRTLFKKGAGLIPSLAFLLASTNLVAELGIVLYLLIGWQFMLGEWIGGVLLVLIMSLLVRLTYPTSLVEAARTHGEPPNAAKDQDGGWHLLARRDNWVRVAQNFVMDWRMLWKDLALGFLVAGALAIFVPDAVWQTLFVKHASPWLQVPTNALLGPLVAVLSFVCSIGNVPMAAILWGAGVSFGGVLAFLYGDLIVLPLLDVYRRYYGWKMAAYIGAIFYAAMVVAAVAMDAAFNALGRIPRRHTTQGLMLHVSLDYTFWLNLAFGVLAAAFVWLSRQRPAMAASHCAHHG